MKLSIPIQIFHQYPQTTWLEEFKYPIIITSSSIFLSKKYCSNTKNIAYCTVLWGHKSKRQDHLQSSDHSCKKTDHTTDTRKPNRVSRIRGDLSSCTRSSRRTSGSNRPIPRSRSSSRRSGQWTCPRSQSRARGRWRWAWRCGRGRALWGTFCGTPSFGRGCLCRCYGASVWSILGLLDLSGCSTGAENTGNDGTGDTSEIRGLTLAGCVFDIAVGAFCNGLRDTGTLYGLLVKRLGELLWGTYSANWLAWKLGRGGKSSSNGQNNEWELHNEVGFVVKTFKKKSMQMIWEAEVEIETNWWEVTCRWRTIENKRSGRGVNDGFM